VSPTPTKFQDRARLRFSFDLTLGGVRHCSRGDSLERAANEFAKLVQCAAIDLLEQLECRRASLDAEIQRVQLLMREARDKERKEQLARERRRRLNEITVEPSAPLAVTPLVDATGTP